MPHKHQDSSIPADVPLALHAKFAQSYHALTQKTDRLLLLAGDHKIEHLDEDFSGPLVHPDAHDPEHLFRIAAHGSIGAFATQFGLIARYGMAYPHVPYIVKMNSKTNLVPTTQQDPFSAPLCTIEDIARLQRESGINICGIGYTIYLGSDHEAEMLQRASEAIIEAHQQGLISIVWAYPRGKSITHEQSPKLLAGAAGVAACLGADFVKLSTPSVYAAHQLSAHELRMIVEAAGRTRVICSGGSLADPYDFLAHVADQLQCGTAGVAIGRNIYQHDLVTACDMTDALSALVYHDADIATAQSYLRIPRTEHYT